MSTALVPFISGAELTDFRNAAALMAQSDGLRACFVGKPANVLIALLTGRDLGLPATIALTRGFVIKGKFDLDTEVKLYIVMDRMPDFEYEVLELDDEHCVARGGLRGKQQHTATFTKKQALAAGLDGYAGPYAQDKLLWRCIGRIIKFTGAGRSMIFAHQVMREAEDEPTPSSPAAHPASGAEVLDGPAATPAEPVQPATVLSPQEMNARPEKQVPVPQDDLGDLLRAVANHYGRVEPGTHKNAYAKWVKDNQDILGKIVALYYGEKSQEIPQKWNMVPPSDHRPIADWLAEKAQARAGNGGNLGGTDAAPARESDPEPADAPPPAEPEDTFGGPEALAKKGLGHLLNVFSGMRQAAKDDQRSFVWKSQRGNWSLVDGKILRALGSLNSENVPMAIWLSEWEKDPVRWKMLCEQVADEATLLGVSYLD